MASSKKRSSEEAENPNKPVSVLSLISENHATRHRPEHTLVGAYTSKAVAVEAAGVVEADGYGTFEDALDKMLEDDHIDNRQNPPDDGCLIQIGSKETGEGNFVRLEIKKMPLQDASSVALHLSKRLCRSPGDISTSSSDDDDDEE
ncbi:expressed unknown protein [Seminavis robusta]|uniref:Uncharacterized protein n=1 Tax=Seminavis robusta TaxID=568900 RepID=A0A9N8HJG1_9STRA|nr:expressed unknown protein [Seminavis robusta]|eukprot:Sro660_g182950.1 n/a (146) ;mRNA; r:10893-11330